MVTFRDPHRVNKLRLKVLLSSFTAHIIPSSGTELLAWTGGSRLVGGA
jgi:hypothetical protein